MTDHDGAGVCSTSPAAAATTGGAPAPQLQLTQAPGGPCVSAEQQASCLQLITSCTRKQEKRKAEQQAGGSAGAAAGGAAGVQHAYTLGPRSAQQQVAGAGSCGGAGGGGGGGASKRNKAGGAAPPATYPGCTSDTSINNDQDNLAAMQLTSGGGAAAGSGAAAASGQQHGQQQEQQPHLVRAACSTLGSMLAPLYSWMPHNSDATEQQAAAIVAAAAAAGGHAGPSAAGGGAWSDENDASLLTAPSTSSAPTVSQPSSTATQPGLQQPSSCPAGAATGGTSGGGHAGANSADDSDECEYDEDDFDPFLFIGSLGPVDRYVQPGRQPLLPRQTRACSKQKTLVLDLDETLVHSTLEEAGGLGADFSFPVTFNGCQHMVHVRTRPHMQAFLERCAELFEVVVFTASQKVYAEKLLNILDPQRSLIRHRIYRDSCVVVDGNYLKDLSVLGRDLSRCAIVDNSPQAFAFQLTNGIPIESWYDDPDDNELLDLLPFLEDIAGAGVSDVRPAIDARFNLGAKVAEAGSRLAAAAAAAAAHQQQLQWQAAQQWQAQQQQQAVAMMAHVASAAAGVLQAPAGMGVQMALQRPQQAQEQAA